MTVKDFSRHLGVSASYIGKLERGQKPPPSRRLLASISSKLGTPLAWLETGEGVAFTKALAGPLKSITRLNLPLDLKFPKILGTISHLEKALETAKEVGALLQKENIDEGVRQILALHENQSVTDQAEKLISAEMQAVMPKLLERLRKATERRGRKRELADWLRVHPQCVTDWLSGRKEPGGETTLRLLHWVEQQERASGTRP